VGCHPSNTTKRDERLDGEINGDAGVGWGGIKRKGGRKEYVSTKEKKATELRLIRTQREIVGGSAKSNGGGFSVAGSVASDRVGPAPATCPLPPSVHAPRGRPA